ncbi:MAG: ketol-acid reductoisomerase [Chlamydiales bacterium]
MQYEEAKEILGKEKIAILGYGKVGAAHALNLRDSGLNVIVGQREGTPSWNKAVEEGWKPKETLFSLEEASQRATFICYLLSDIGQIQFWTTLYKYLTAGKTLLFASGFSIAFADQTKVLVPKEVDVILIGTKGPAYALRQLFLSGEGVNASYAVHQDVSGKAKEKTLAYGKAIGVTSLFETTFEKEAHSDLVGERGALLGGFAALLETQYELLRRKGHSPDEAFNETVEELTQSLIPFIAENGMDALYRICSTTAQRGALDWLPRFKKALQPLFEELYEGVASGKEAEAVITQSRQSDYKNQLDQELKQMAEKEIWQVGKRVRSQRH